MGLVYGADGMHKAVVGLSQCPWIWSIAPVGWLIPIGCRWGGGADLVAIMMVKPLLRVFYWDILPICSHYSY